MRKILYLCDLSLPNKSAYCVHVMKMCEAFAVNNNVELVVNSSSIDWKEIKKNFKLDYKFKIYPLRIFKNRNFFFRILNAIKTYKIIKKNNYDLIISRNIISSLVLAILDIKNVLEIHTELTGFTSEIYTFLNNNSKIKKNIKYIFIHRNLKKYFNLKENKFIILDDAVKVSDFQNLKIKTLKNTFVYTGSLLEGKGIEIIIALANHYKNYKFKVYGNLDTLPKKLLINKSLKNLNIENYIPYYKIPKVLGSSEFLLMPYPKKIGVLIKDLDVKDYISPLKMFEYLSAKKIIFASYQNSYKHILKNNFNSILIRNNKISEWIKSIDNAVRNRNKFSKIKQEAFRTAKKYTWKKRSEKILRFYNEK